jgi:hypothetical protein
MKFKVVEYSFTKAFAGSALFPADASDEYVRNALQRTATYAVDEWWGEWESDALTTESVEWAAKDCAPTNSFFKKEGSLVWDTAKMQLVNAEDASWYIATEAEVADEKQALAVEAGQLSLW